MASKPSPVGASPIESILLVEKFRPANTHFHSTSLPGHLLHLTLSGQVRQRCNGREYLLKKGSLIWYHEDEFVEGTVLQAPWAFFSVNFIAPQLPPPSFEHRLQSTSAPKVFSLFDELWQAWRASHLPPRAREYTVHSTLLRILLAISSPEQQALQFDPRARLWWELESALREDMGRKIDLPLMERLSGRSTATIARSCRHALGVAPMQRLKQVKMSLARGLLRQSTFNVTEVSRRIGYERVHDFSRDYRKFYGFSPKTTRMKDQGVASK